MPRITLMLPLALATLACNLSARPAASLEPTATAYPAQPSYTPLPTYTPYPTATYPPGFTPVPTSTALAPETPAPALPGEGPSLGGCPLYPADHIWNVRVDSLPVDPNSDRYIAALGAATGLHPDFGAGLWEGSTIGIPYTTVGPDQPLVPVSFYYPDESETGPYPIPADVPIEGGPDSDGDRHLLILSTGDCLLYEVYDAWPQPDGSWEAGSGAVFDLRGHALRPDSWTSADAAGLAILPGLVRYEEVAAGEIRHAIRFTASAIRYSYTWPARHRAECGGYGEDDVSVPPMGQRFRLKSEFDISGYSPQTQVILRAMQRYGMVLADCGADWYISGAPDDRWVNDVLVPEFSSVPGSAFEAVDVSGLMLDPDSGQTR